MSKKSNVKKPAGLAAVRGSVTRELQYIADSPERKYGGFHIHAVTTAKSALQEIRRLRRAVKWALGENGDFEQRPEGAGAYWWRTELRRRAGMSPNEKI
jgi:hypothetical protein